MAIKKQKFFIKKDSQNYRVNTLITQIYYDRMPPPKAYYKYNYVFII